MTARRSAGPPSGSDEAPGTIRTLYAIWGAIGLSILVQFGVVLALQRQGVTQIAPDLGASGATTHVVVASVLFVAAALGVGLLRRRARDVEWLAGARGATAPPGGAPRAGGVRARGQAVSVAAWAVAEAYALVGFVLALALPPVPRLALTLYFTGALLLWLWSRPDPEALAAAHRRDARGG